MWLPSGHPRARSQRRQDLTDDEQDKDQDEHREVAVARWASSIRRRGCGPDSSLLGRLGEEGVSFAGATRLEGHLPGWEPVLNCNITWLGKNWNQLMFKIIRNELI